MSQPGSIGNIVPRNEDWIAREIADLKRQIQELRGARPMDAATIGSGGIEIVDGGSLTMRNAAGQDVLYEGIDTIHDGSGRKQQVFQIYRDEDGSAALSLSDFGTTPGHLHQQALQITDRAGHIVFAEDAAGHGLARPYVGGGVFLTDTNTAHWPQTTNAAFVDIAFGYYTVQNARLQWDIDTVADGGTTGQVRLMVNGTQIDTTQAVTAAFALWTRIGVAFPAGVNIGDVVSIQLQARRTAGAGNVYATTYRFEGDQA